MFQIVVSRWIDFSWMFIITIWIISCWLLIKKRRSDEYIHYEEMIISSLVVELDFFKWFILFYNLIQFCSNVYFMFDGWCLIFRFCRFENFIILEIICWVYIAFRGAHRSTLNFSYFMWHGILWKNSNF